MYDRKSDYAYNKKNNSAIVYKGVNGIQVLTERDFENEKEFKKWKKWSDCDYRVREKEGRKFYDCVLLCEEEGRLDLEEDEHEMQERKVLIKKAMMIKKRLTPTQYRRLWLYAVRQMTILEIAQLEGISFQNVAKSISSAKRKAMALEKIWRENEDWY